MHVRENSGSWYLSIIELLHVNFHHHERNVFRFSIMINLVFGEGNIANSFSLEILVRLLLPRKIIVSFPTFFAYKGKTSDRAQLFK